MTISGSFRRVMKITGSRHSALDVARGRLVLISACFLLAYVMVIARVVDLSLIQGEWQQQAQQDVIVPDDENAEKLHAFRGDIMDRNGVLLATSLETASLYADPSLVPDPEEVAQDLLSVFPDLGYGTALQKLQRKGRFVWIRRNLTPLEQFEVLKLGHPGLSFKEEFRRIYPQGPLAAHMVGYTNIDGIGLAGIERSFNELLSEATDQPLKLTIDIRLQHILRRELVQAVEGFSAKGGTAVIMDVTNGDILAAVSAPDLTRISQGMLLRKPCSTV